MLQTRISDTVTATLLIHAGSYRFSTCGSPPSASISDSGSSLICTSPCVILTFTTREFLKVALLHSPRDHEVSRAIDRAEARVLIKQLADVGEIGPLCVCCWFRSRSRPHFAHHPRKGVLLGLLARRLSCVCLQASDCYRVTHAKSACALLFLHIRSRGVPAIWCTIRSRLILT